MGKIVVVAILVLVIIGISVFVGIKYAITAENSPFFRVYVDSDKYFTLSIPVTWNDSHIGGVGMTNIGSVYQSSQRIEVVRFSSFNMNLNIQVIEATPNCADSIAMHQHISTTLAGLPALYDPTNTTWYLKTANASYIITANYPGSNGKPSAPIKVYSLSVPKPPVPHLVKDQYKELLTRVIKSFHPYNATIFSCY